MCDGTVSLARMPNQVAVSIDQKGGNPIVPTTHRLSQYRIAAQLELNEHRTPVAVVIMLDTGDRVRIDRPADLGRLIRTLRSCEDQWTHERKRARGHGQAPA